MHVHVLFLRFFLEFSTFDPQDVRHMTDAFTSVILPNKFTVADIPGKYPRLQGGVISGNGSREIDGRERPREQERREQVAAARARAYWRHTGHDDAPPMIRTPQELQASRLYLHYPRRHRTSQRMITHVVILLLVLFPIPRRKLAPSELRLPRLASTKDILKVRTMM